MNSLPLQTGSVVLSRAGRDEGRILAVLREVDEDFVLTVDGKLRTMEKPKKKRRRHLRPTGRVLEEMKSRIENGQTVYDHELRAWLNQEEG